MSSINLVVRTLGPQWVMLFKEAVESFRQGTWLADRDPLVQGLWVSSAYPVKVLLLPYCQHDVTSCFTLPLPQLPSLSSACFRAVRKFTNTDIFPSTQRVNVHRQVQWSTHLASPGPCVEPSSWILTGTLTHLDLQSMVEVTVWCVSPGPQI